MKKNINTRRGFLINSGKASIALGLSQTIFSSFTNLNSLQNKNVDNLFVQKPLSYGYTDLQ